MERSAVKTDAIVIGSGQGGVPLAVDLAGSGKSVVLFERAELGGTCINTGCTPSKSFLAAAHTAGRARSASALGVRGDVTIDFGATMERVRGIIASFREGVQRRIESAGVRCVHGEASFVDAKTVAAGEHCFTAPLIVIDTGASPAAPPIEGLASVSYLTDKTFFAQKRLPKRVVVVGGGYIGLELGQGIARCGARVDIIQHADRVLEREEPDVSDVLERALRADGIALHLACDVVKVARSGDAIAVTLSNGTVLAADALLVATGRVPNTAALRCDAAGIALDRRGYITIDDRFHTTADGVYAIGDVAGQPAFTHVSWEDYRRVKAILAGKERTRHDRVLGYAVYTEPQVGRAGLTLDEARASGIPARAVTLPVTNIARGIEWGQELGFYRLVVDERDDRILGATLVGYETAELVHVFIALMEAGATWQTLEQMVGIHPTYGEGLPSLARLLVHG
ncbi:MAG TPA: FAD-dependent oxidoreductase [Candidatus Binatia bacterium]|nr:FAD-dependent oxidoreductase [Candidatus Binatia bacterium]